MLRSFTSLIIAINLSNYVLGLLTNSCVSKSNLHDTTSISNAFFRPNINIQDIRRQTKNNLLRSAFDNSMHIYSKYPTKTSYHESNTKLHYVLHKPKNASMNHARTISKNYFGSRKIGNGYHHMKDCSDEDGMKTSSTTTKNILNLLNNAISRANNNISYSKFEENDSVIIEPVITATTESADIGEGPVITDFLGNTINRAESITNTYKRKTNDSSNEKNSGLKWSYLSQPCITTTALAHSLWKSVINPSNDVVIDATCGNGKDSLAMAKMLFPSVDDTPSSSPYKNESPSIICIDVQESAIANTANKLQEYLGTSRFENCVTMLCTSHAPLPTDIIKNRKVGLICYNLGYLPGSEKNIQTMIETTLESLAYAASIIRVHGLISVVAYPQTNQEEAIAVSAFMEGLALMNENNDWIEFISETLKDENKNIHDIVYNALFSVCKNLGTNQVWRVFEHRPLGRALSPSLLTAVKIK